MKQASQETSPSKESPSSQDEQSISISDTDASENPAAEAASRLAALPGNPRFDEVEIVQGTGVPVPAKPHKMKKRRYMGRDFYECGECHYTTFNAKSANQHTKRPV